MTVLQIDIETYSSTDLKKCGVHRYVEAKDFEILLFAYAFDEEPVTVIDLTDFESIPEDVLDALIDSSIVKTAFNAAFERTCLAKWLGGPLPAEQWRCTAVHALALGLPPSLDSVATALNLDATKDARGKNLIKYFSVPCKPTKVNGERLRNHPHHAPDKWQAYMEYCKQDVVVERAVRHKLGKFPIPDKEWKLWALDQRINDRGVRLDSLLVQQAIDCSKQYAERLLASAKEITGLENPNSLTQLKAWFADRGLQTPNGITKDTLPTLLTEAVDEDTKRMLELRQEMGKTSNSKYEAMGRAICADNRVKGILQFCGASRTWRWAGRNIQAQNLPQNHLEDLAQAREILRSGDFDLLELLYGAPPFVLSQLVRTMLIPSKGHRFIISDFSAIEARVIAWLADEHWVLDVFRGHGKIYEATASRMFRVPFETIVKGHENYKYRAPGKVATLACIAEGQLVLTHKGLVPIEEITTAHLLWDGVSWVPHDGVIERGVKEVFEYDGLTATADHKVWISGQSRPVRFDDAAASGSRLIQSGFGRRTIRVGVYHQPGETMGAGLKRNHRQARVYDILNAGPLNRFTVSGKLVHNCGFGGGVAALESMDKKKEIPEEEYPRLVRQWREANPNIRKLWYRAEEAAMEAVRSKTTVKLAHGVQYRYKAGMLFADLPSGHSLAYPSPAIQPDPKFDGKEGLTFNAPDKTGKMMRQRTWGGTLVENLVQAIARDCLAESLLRLDEAGYIIRLHVHDEVVLDVMAGIGSVEGVTGIMSKPIDWAPELPLAAEGFECDFYQKD